MPENNKRPAEDNMGAVKVTVKWGKETFSDVEARLDESPLVFKSQLFALTGVPPDRQKVMIKGALLKDDDWGKAVPKEGATVSLLGSAEPHALVEPPKNLPKFVEDLPESQQVGASNCVPDHDLDLSNSILPTTRRSIWNSRAMELDCRTWGTLATRTRCFKFYMPSSHCARLLWTTSLSQPATPPASSSCLLGNW
jgi:hypothetical protein